MHNQQITIKRLATITDKLIQQLNPLLDEGTEWDVEHGKVFLENSDNALFVAFIENEAIGFLTAHRLGRFDKRKAEILLYEIGVEEGYRQRGVGKTLVKHAKNWGKEVGADELWVVTNKSNTAAIGLYQSVGANFENTDDVMYSVKL